MHADISDEIFRPIVADDLTLILEWRNHPDVRRFMYTQHKISMAEHLKWFSLVDKDSSRNPMIYEKQGVPVGFASFSLTVCEATADWGFYIAPDAPKGAGRQLGTAALNYAFGELSLHKVCGQAIEYNDRSIRYHKSLGFKQEGLLREQYFDGKNHHAIVCFGMLRHEWFPND